MGLSFFKLSVGMGTMITYGSYFREDQNIPTTAVRVMLGDVLVSILAGIAIFPAVFAFGFKPDAGPSLLFITIPAVFNSMPFGQVVHGAVLRAGGHRRDRRHALAAGSAGGVAERAAGLVAASGHHRDHGHAGRFRRAGGALEQHRWRTSSRSA